MAIGAVLLSILCVPVHCARVHSDHSGPVQLCNAGVCERIHNSTVTPEQLVAGFDKFVNSNPGLFESCTVEKLIDICGEPPVLTCAEVLDRAVASHEDNVKRFGISEDPGAPDRIMRSLCWSVDQGVPDILKVYKPCTRANTSPFCESLRATGLLQAEQEGPVQLCNADTVCEG